MRIIFVLLIWGALFTFLGIPIAVGLGIWSCRNQKRSPHDRNKYRPIIAAILPYVLLAYGGVAFIAYGLWCESIRHVDAGIGDAASVPIGNAHFFCMIDIPDSGYILKGGCSGSPAISEIAELAVVGDRIVGKSKSSGSFIFNTRSEVLQKYDNLDLALTQFTPRPTLESVDSFYAHSRWGLPDVIALLIIGIPVI
jgi:hypothetical protein